MKWEKKKREGKKKNIRRSTFGAQEIRGGEKPKKNPIACISLSLMKTKEQNTKEYIKNIITPQV
jgi:hypothetical protein